MEHHTLTIQEQLTALMRLPWTVKVDTDDADGSLVAQVGEIPDAIGTGKDVKQLARDLWESLRASLEIRLEHEDDVPLPEGCSLPWAADQNRHVETRLRVRHVGHLRVQIRANA